MTLTYCILSIFIKNEAIGDDLHNNNILVMREASWTNLLDTSCVPNQGIIMFSIIMCKQHFASYNVLHFFYQISEIRSKLVLT